MPVGITHGHALFGLSDAEFIMRLIIGLRVMEVISEQEISTALQRGAAFDFGRERSKSRVQIRYSSQIPPPHPSGSLPLAIEQRISQELRISSSLGLGLIGIKHDLPRRTGISRLHPFMLVDNINRNLFDSMPYGIA